ncbi:hypothetical protein [Paenibacillus sophorae]|uniref:Uncharacterized protein n=1 Tax=Paenibacillus sophorae TaxID=1333845 RepID=A0ABX8HER0_9BACL|nr:hypothetical protein [Paenibacillus sophorae]QWU16553.1 hypothetical protein KP014_04795 [Paenibacillus sophorae]
MNCLAVPAYISREDRECGLRDFVTKPPLSPKIGRVRLWRLDAVAL